jgi:putative membrane protein
MINYLIRLLASAAVIYVLPRYLKGINVDSLTTAFIVALVMSLLNGFVKPIIGFLSLPVTILTLGLFHLVIVVAIVYLCDYLVKGFSVEGFLPPLLFSFALSIVNWVVSMFQGD